MSGEKSCPKCKKWNDSKQTHCVFCGAELYEKERLQRENLEANPDPFQIPLIKINTKDGYLVVFGKRVIQLVQICLLYTSPSPRDVEESRMPSSA